MFGWSSLHELFHLYNFISHDPCLAPQVCMTCSKYTFVFHLSGVPDETIVPRSLKKCSKNMPSKHAQMWYYFVDFVPRNIMVQSKINSDAQFRKT